MGRVFEARGARRAGQPARAVAARRGGGYLQFVLYGAGRAASGRRRVRWHAAASAAAIGSAERELVFTSCTSHYKTTTRHTY